MKNEMENSAKSNLIKLANIFRPYAMKRWSEVVAQRGRFVHYTSAENAMRIIESKQFWMRNAKCMNDYMEVSHGHDLLVKFFQNKNPDHRKLFYSTLEPCGKEIAQKAISSIDTLWDKIEFNTFIGSISEHDIDENAHGRLSMWRANGTASAKAAIVLNIPFEPDNPIEGLRLVMSPVRYFGYENVEKEFTEVINNIKNNIDFLRVQGSQVIINSIFTMLVIAAVSLKHVSFREEREWRLIYLPDFAPSKLMSREIEIISGVPQPVYQIPLMDNPAENVVGIGIPQLIDRIIIGPSEYPYPLYQAFTTILEKAGVDNPGSRVIISGIPLRT
jgi:hypothetical protein